MAKPPLAEADWQGIELISRDVGSGNKPKRWRHGGHQYATLGEYRLAVLLDHFGIPFTPDVPFVLDSPKGEKIFVADFIFDKELFLWTGRGKRQLIHGIEVKGRCKPYAFSGRALEKVQLLKDQRNINVLLLSNASIKQYFYRNKLPLRPYEK